MRARVACVTLTVLLAASGVVAVPSLAAGQEMETEVGGEAQGAVRIVARRLADGRTEFGLRQELTDGRWAAPRLPRLRFFPAGARVGRWLASSPVTVNVAARPAFDPTGEIELRIVARRVADGRTEFALQQRRADGGWGSRLLPARRFFPVAATVGRWLASAPLTVTATRADSTGFAIGGRSRSGDTLVASNYDRTCAVRLDGGVTCWGHNGLRERVSAAGLDDIVTVTVGGNVNSASHTCVLHDDGRVSCWGPGSDGQLGQGDDARHYVPARVPGITDAVAIAAGREHTCAVHADGGVSCWGEGDSGALGDGTSESKSFPQRVPGVQNVATIVAFQSANCAVHFDGTISCWGWGAGGTNHRSPWKVPGLRGATSVALGWGNICAVTAEKRVYCWTNSTRPLPTRVGNLDDVAAVSVGRQNFCALHTDGGVSCWGTRNFSGELGDGTTEPRSQPRRLAGITDAVAITTSVGSSVDARGDSKEIESHACAMHRDGSVSCWGNNRFGQLGDGTFGTRLVPTPVGDFDDIGVARPPTDATQFLRTWMDAVVAKHEGRFPWLRAAWEHARSRSAVAILAVGGAVSHFCQLPSPPVKCTLQSYEVNSVDLSIALHELAHVYDITTGLAPSRAWGAAQLYFAVKMSECTPQFDHRDTDVELLADALLHVVAPHSRLLYYNSFECPGSAGGPSPEAEEVILSALAGEVPDWYTENITNGAELWAALRQDLSLHMLANLMDEFGGFCSTAWIDNWRTGGDAHLPPAASNPFRDGGCQRSGRGRRSPGD